MKMVIDGNAGAGTITMGGFDYHTGDRSTGELRDFRAGKCIGACLEYAARTNKPLMIYVFSDGSLSSSGMIDNSVDGRGKGVWTNDNQSTASTFFLVYNPKGRAIARAGAGAGGMGQQIGFFNATARSTALQVLPQTRSTCWCRRWCLTISRCMARKDSSSRCSRTTGSGPSRCKTP